MLLRDGRYFLCLSGYQLETFKQSEVVNVDNIILYSSTGYKN